MKIKNNNLAMKRISLNLVFKGEMTTISLVKDIKTSKISANTVKHTIVVNAVKQMQLDLHDS